MMFQSQAAQNGTNGKKANEFSNQYAVRSRDGRARSLTSGQLCAFSVPLRNDLHSGDCIAQLHNAANTPCPGQEPSKIVPLSEDTFVTVADKTHFPSTECASTIIYGPIKKKFLDHFHKKSEHKPEPKPEQKPHPEPEHLFLDHFHKKEKHFFSHLHKNPILPKPEPKPESKSQPAPEYHNPTPTPSYGSPTPIYHPLVKQ
ncbi:hypothetical protein ABZP36_012558 [Zizania latifolia]